MVNRLIQIYDGSIHTFEWKDAAEKVGYTLSKHRDWSGLRQTLSGLRRQGYPQIAKAVQVGAEDATAQYKHGVMTPERQRDPRRLRRKGARRDYVSNPPKLRTYALTAKKESDNNWIIDGESWAENDPGRHKKPKKRKTPAAFKMKLTPSPRLAAVIGGGKVTRGEAMKRIWAVIKRRKLQLPGGRISVNDVLKPLFPGKRVAKVTDVPGAVSRNLK